MEHGVHAFEYKQMIARVVRDRMKSFAGYEREMSISAANVLNPRSIAYALMPMLASDSHVS